ncbi:MAG: PilT/PilU family type 4a pilus ATPase [Verrucomicrobia bacterium]|nr:PilT/PilU family type 4a pilus ATPase [Verrucomicrobiota bacterium]
MVARGASDLHMTTGFRPFIRVSGDMMSMADAAVLTPESCRMTIDEIMPQKNRREFEERWDTDFAYAIDSLGRFRVNVFMDRFGVGCVLRLIPSVIPTFEELGLPKAVRDFCYLSKGLVLVTGPTGSGKSTTLAAMIDLINRTRTDHIITIEDPIEFVHTPQRCLVNQREVHSHTRGFAAALRAALREDPDIVLVGEIRDLETMEIAIETAETGHLVFGTLHTNTAVSTVNRIINKFPANQQNQIRTMLADSLKGVIAQTLCKRIPKGRVAAMEILVMTTAIASNIREGKTHMIGSSLQTGMSVGMQTYSDAFLALVKAGLVQPREAYLKAVDKGGLLRLFATAGIALDLETLVEAPDGPVVPQTPARAPAASERQELAGPLADFLKKCVDEARQNPEDPQVLNNLAWALSTNADPRLRDASQAVRVAEKALTLTNGRDPAILDTLGAAYAESGRYDKALDWARKGMELARKTGQDVLAETLARRIRLYESGQPHRDPGP